MTRIQAPTNDEEQEALSAMKNEINVNPMIKYLSNVVAYSLQEENSLAIAEEKELLPDNLKKKVSMQLRVQFFNKALEALDRLALTVKTLKDLNQETTYLLLSRDVLDKLESLNSEQISMLANK